MDGEPIDLAHIWDKTRLRRWRAGDGGGWWQVHVTLGHLGDGRWFSETTERGLRVNGWAWPTREDAERDVERLKAGRDGWVDAPARFNAFGEPEGGELGPWRRVGGGWVLDD